ncbi:MAG: nitrile hydratase subunit beta [bacterium]|nr:nitrile hydratase subunit beta [bacterium]
MIPPETARPGPTPRFRIGDRVRIDARPLATHHRVPAYAKGQTGVIIRVCGEHEEPERLAFGQQHRLRRLYRVRLQQTDLWKTYEGSPTDTLDIEIFDHWLQPA